MMISKNELACEILERSQERNRFAKSLILIIDHCITKDDKELLPLLMDSLVVLGDLVASEYFNESLLFIEYDLYSILRRVLNSHIVGSIEPAMVNLNSERGSGNLIA